MDKQLYEYAIILQEEEDENTGKVITQAEILVQPTLVLAKSQRDVDIMAARAIPEEQIENIDRITLVVRPF